MLKATSALSVSIMTMIALLIAQTYFCDYEMLFRRGGQLFECRLRRGWVIVDNDPQRNIEQQQDADRRQEVAALVRRDVEIFNDFQISPGGNNRRRTPQQLQIEAHLAELESSQELIIRRLGKLGYVPRISNTIADPGPQYIANAKLDFEFEKIMTLPDGSPQFSKIPTPISLSPRICLFLPLWVLIAVTAVLPAVRLAQFLRVRQRVRRGLCRNCGYDLRHGRGRCPECGWLKRLQTDDDGATSG